MMKVPSATSMIWLLFTHSVLEHEHLVARVEDMRLGKLGEVQRGNSELGDNDEVLTVSDGADLEAGFVPRIRECWRPP